MPDTIRYYLTWLLFIGVYVGVAFPEGGAFKIPVAVGGLAGILLLCLNYDRVRIQHLYWILAMLTFCLISIVLRAYTLPEMSIQKHLTNHVLSWAVLAYAIFIGYMAYLEMVEWDRNQVARMFHVLVVILLVGTALEVFVPPFKELSDVFRESVFERGVYDADLRDVVVYGGIRPKLFTKEPSHLATYFTLFTVAWLFATNNKNKYLLFFCYVFIGLFLIRSPVILMAPVFGLAQFLVRSEEGSPHRKIVFLVFLLLIFTPLTLLFMDVALGERINRIAEGRDVSFIIRFLAPWRVMLNVLDDYPILGLGFGAKEIGFKYMEEAMSALVSKRNYGFPDLLGHNFMFLGFVNFGLIGFAIFLTIFWRMIAVFAVRDLPLVLIAMVGFMQSMGSPNSVRFWFIFFILCTIAYISSPQAAESRERPRHAPELAPHLPAAGGQ